jgi:hypothetical protein
MAISVIQTSAKNYGGSLSLAFTSNNTGGNAIIVGANVGYCTSPTISDSQGNSYTLIQTTGTANTNVYSALWLCSSCAAGSNTVTLGGTGLAAGSCAIGIMEVSGVNTKDQTGGTTGSGAISTWTSNAITTTVANELLVSTVANGYGSLGGGLSGSVASENYFYMTYSIVSSIQTGYSASGSQANNGSNNWSVLLSSFYQAATATPRECMLMGVGL